MAFDTATTRITSVNRVALVLSKIRSVNAFAHDLNDALLLYQSGTDPAFNAAFDAIFNVAADRSELGTMIQQLRNLAITDWEANHPGVIGA